MSKPAIPIRATLAVVTRPDLWATGVRAALRFRPRRGGRLGPYVAFRLETQYGGDGRDREPDPDDLVTYLHWCRDLPR